MPPIWTYHDYRAYMQDAYAERKARGGFTWREFAAQAGFASPVYLKLVCEGKTSLSLAGAAQVASALGLSAKEGERFKSMVELSLEKDAALRDGKFQELRRQSSKVGALVIGEEQYDYYTHWLGPTLRELAPQLAPQESETPQIRARLAHKAGAYQIRDTLALLLRLGLLEQGPDGAYHQTHKHITTGPLSPELSVHAVRSMHRQMGELALESLDQTPVEERDISGLTVGVSEEAFAEIREELAKCRAKVAQIAEKSRARKGEKEAVYRLNLQLFPLAAGVSKANKGGKNG